MATNEAEPQDRKAACRPRRKIALHAAAVALGLAASHRGAVASPQLFAHEKTTRAPSGICMIVNADDPVSIAMMMPASMSALPNRQNGPIFVLSGRAGSLTLFPASKTWTYTDLRDPNAQQAPPTSSGPLADDQIGTMQTIMTECASAPASN